MKALITAVLIALAGAGAGVAQAASADPSTWVDAVVKKVDKSGKRVVLTHGALPNGMPAMTMTFGVKEPVWLDQMAPGQKIRFTLPASGELTVARFEAVK